MKLNVTKEVAALKRLTNQELRAKDAEVFGDATPSGNRAWLIRRVISRLQAVAEGGLSERARRRAAELADDAELRVVPPAPPRPAKPAAASRPTPAAPDAARAKVGRPMPGTVLSSPLKKRLTAVIEYGSACVDSLAAA